MKSLSLDFILLPSPAGSSFPSEANHRKQNSSSLSQIEHTGIILPQSKL